MSEAPKYWVTQLEEGIAALQQIPLWGFPPKFPWAALEDRIAKDWQTTEVKFFLDSVKWHEEKELTAGLGAHPQLFSFSLTPLKESAILAISSEDAARISKTALAPNTLTNGFSDPQLQKGFFAFLLLKTAGFLNELHAFEDLSISFEENPKLPQNGAIVINLKLEVNNASFWIRIISSQKLHSSFSKHFAKKRPLFSLDLAKSLDLPIHIIAGSTSLKLQEWKKIKKGDLLLLDRCTYDPKTHKGSVELVLDGAPLFRARVKEESIKILDYAFYYEEEKVPMKDDDDDDEEMFADEEKMHGDFFDEEEEDYEDEEDESDEEIEDSDEEEPLESGEEVEQESPLWKTEEKEDSEALHKKITASQIPLTVTVEIARINIPVEKLLELKPGNEIPLPVRPEQGVYLLISGKRIAKAELIKIGETLGVRILEIGE